MRIAIVSSEFVHNKDGGLANYTYRLALYLKKLGHEPIVVVPENRTEQTIFDNIDLHFVEFKITNSSRKWLVIPPKRPTTYEIFEQRSKQVNLYLKQLNVDLVQYAHLGGIGKFRLPNVPSVIRLSSNTRMCFMNGGYGESKEQMEQQERIEFESIKIADAVFGPSNAIAGITEDQTGVSVRVIETPYQEEIIDEDYTVYEELNINRYVLFFGSLVQLKGIDIIANVLEEFLTNNDDLHYVFVGKSIPRRDGVCVVELIKNSAGNCVDRVHFTGNLNQAQLKPFIRNAETITLPSLVDNFPNACIEAMALGKCVIGTYNNGFEQLIEDEVSGFLCKPGDSKELLKSIEKSINISEQAKLEMSRLAIERIQQLRPERLINQLVSFYKETIEKHKKCAE
ncbi:MAG: glycosyltransferase family 4 protein [Flavobacteriales bacterium]|nr:glycosyltransferase family 4 protein [Flavobacteriales bacterium]